ncbi:MAG: hypothetical protein GY679_03980 [Mycoplasma sp.]|nr:hypothetical protein [Mycoplasma sp.]
MTNLKGCKAVSGYIDKNGKQFTVYSCGIHKEFVRKTGLPRANNKCLFHI